MPRRKRITPNSITAQVEDEVNRELDGFVAAIAAEEGLARGAVHVSPEQEVQMWGQRDPRVDYDTLKQQLMTGQVPPEWYDPESDARLAVVRVNPEWAEVFAGVTPETPLDDQMASIVAEMAEWPFRLSVLAPYQDDPAAQVRKAESINQRWLRRGDRAAFGEPSPGGVSAPASTTLGFDEAPAAPETEAY